MGLKLITFRAAAVPFGTDAMNFVSAAVVSAEQSAAIEEGTACTDPVAPVAARTAPVIVIDAAISNTTTISVRAHQPTRRRDPPNVATVIEEPHHSYCASTASRAGGQHSGAADEYSHAFLPRTRQIIQYDLALFGDHAEFARYRHWVRASLRRVLDSDQRVRQVWPEVAGDSS